MRLVPFLISTIITICLIVILSLMGVFRRLGNFLVLNMAYGGMLKTLKKISTQIFHSLN